MRREMNQRCRCSLNTSITSHTLISSTSRRVFSDRLISFKIYKIQQAQQNKWWPPMVWSLRESHHLRDLTLWRKKPYNRKSLTSNTNSPWSRTCAPPWSSKTKTIASSTWMPTSKSWLGNTKNSSPLSSHLKSIWRMFWSNKANWLPCRKTL